MALWVSQLVDCPVVSPSGRRLGLVRDIVIDVRAKGYPPLRGIVVHTPARKALVLVPVAQVTALKASVRLLREDLLLARVASGAGDVLVWRDLVDRLAIDARLARVGIMLDAVLQPVDGRLSLVGARMGPARLLRRLAPRVLAPRDEERCVDWDDVVPATEWSFRAPAHRARLARLSAWPPALLVRMVNVLTYRQAGDVLGALEAGPAAQTVAMIVPDHRIAILRSMPTASLVEILHALPADAVSHVLGGLPARQVAELLMADAGLAISVCEPAVWRR